jgi:hypothetical protein
MFVVSTNYIDPWVLEFVVSTNCIDPRVLEFVVSTNCIDPWVLEFVASNTTGLIIPLVSFGHCVVCSSIYGFWLSFWYLLTIVLSVLLLFTDSDYPFGIVWPLCCLFFYLRILIIPFVSFDHCVVCSSSIFGFWLSLLYRLAIVLSVLLLFTDSDDPFGIFWPLCCLFFYLRILMILLVSFGHCVVCSSIYGFWLSLWYLLTIVLSVLLFTDSDYPFGIFWPLCCLFFFYLWILIIPLVSFDHCVVCSSSIYGF